jgi:hypothetical protein
MNRQVPLYIAGASAATAVALFLARLKAYFSIASNLEAAEKSIARAERTAQAIKKSRKPTATASKAAF